MINCHQQMMMILKQGLEWDYILTLFTKSVNLFPKFNVYVVYFNSIFEAKILSGSVIPQNRCFKLACLYIYYNIITQRT